MSQLQTKYRAITEVEPNTLHFDSLTRLYKITSGRLKRWPFLWVVPLCLLVSIASYFVFGSLWIHLVSVLQWGS